VTVAAIEAGILTRKPTSDDANHVFALLERATPAERVRFLKRLGMEIEDV